MQIINFGARRGSNLLCALIHALLQVSSAGPAAKGASGVPRAVHGPRPVGIHSKFPYKQSVFRITKNFCNPIRHDRHLQLGCSTFLAKFVNAFLWRKFALHTRRLPWPATRMSCKEGKLWKSLSSGCRPLFRNCPNVNDKIDKLIKQNHF